MKQLFLFLALIFQINFVFSQDLVPFLNEGKWQLYDKTTKELKPEIYQQITPTQGNVIFIKQNKKWNAINRKGQKLLMFDYDVLKYFKNGLIYAQNDEIIRLFNSDGTPFITENLYDASEYKYDNSKIVIQDINKKYGIISLDGKTIIPANYDYAFMHYNEKYLKAGLNMNGYPIYGLYSSDLKLLIPAVYKYIRINQSGYFCCNRLDGKFDLYNQSGELQWTGDYEVTAVMDKCFRIIKEEKQGLYFRKTGVTIWNENIHLVDWGRFILICDEIKNITHFYNENGEEKIIQGGYYSQNSDSKYMVIKSSENEGGNNNDFKPMSIINSNGDIVYRNQKGSIRNWSDSTCVIFTCKKVANNDYSRRYDLINIFTKDTIFTSFNNELNAMNHGFVLEVKDKEFIYNNKGEKIVDSIYSNINHYGLNESNEPISIPGLYLVDKRVKYKNYYYPIHLYGYIDSAFKVVYPCVYRSVEYLKDNYGEKQNKRIVFSMLDSTMNYSYKSALFNGNFKQITPYKYSYISYYDAPYIRVQKNENIENSLATRVGLIDTNGKVVLSPIYDDASYVKNVGFIVTKFGRTGVINMRGKVIIPLNFKSIRLLSNQFFQVSEFDKIGIYSFEGKELVKPSKFEIKEVGLLEGTLFYVVENEYSKEEKQFYIGSNGVEYKK